MPQPSLMEGGKHKPLPPGLDPVTAGRFGLWLMGRWNVARAARRTVSARRINGSGEVNRLATLLVPWSVEEYPGYRKFLASLCGVAVATSDDWLYGTSRLPRKHAARFAAICEERAAAFAALAVEFEAIASRPVDPGGRRKHRAPRGG